MKELVEKSSLDKLEGLSSNFRAIAPVKKAFEKLFFLYSGQSSRQGWGKPYFSHMFSVWQLLGSYDQAPDVCLAGFFHSALNDLPNYTYADLVNDTDTNIARLVQELSEKNRPRGIRNKKANWRLRKEDILKRFPEMSIEAKIIFVIAQTDYLSSLLEYHSLQGEKIWSRLNASKKEMGWYYLQLEDLLPANLQHPLISDYHFFLNQAKKRFHWREE